MKFSEFYDSVSFDLRQQDEVSFGTSSNSKPLPPDAARRITNEQIVRLRKLNPNSRDAVEITHTFAFAAESFSLPENVIVLFAWKTGSTWQMLESPYSDASALQYETNETIRGSFKIGDTITLRVLLSPMELIDDDSIVEFPKHSIETLRKTVVIEAASIVGIELTDLYAGRFAELINEWKGYYSGRVVERLNAGKSMQYRGK